jgi:rhamnose transport system substrate-binding protein
MQTPLRHKLSAAGTALLCATLLGIGVAAHAADLKSGLKIAFVPKQINNPYEVIADDGGMAAIKEFKGDGKVVGPSDAGASSQVQYINTLTTQRQDAIVIAANDANALVPYLKKAMSQGIKVVTFDSDTAPEGRGQIQLVSKLMGGEGEFAILSATPNATNQNTWIKWMQEELKKPEYAKLKLVKIAYGNDDDQKSFVETQGLLQAYPNLKAIVAPTSVGIAAAARYISTSSSKGKVAVTGLGTPNQMRAFVKNGTVKAFQLWDPGQLGYLAAYAAAGLASGSITGKEGESFDAGKLGKRTIGAHGEVILGPPTTFDAANIDNFNF